MVDACTVCSFVEVALALHPRLGRIPVSGDALSVLQQVSPASACRDCAITRLLVTDLLPTYHLLF